MSSPVQLIGKGIYVVDTTTANELLVKVNAIAVAIPAGENIIGKVRLIDASTTVGAQIQAADSNNYLFCMNHSSRQVCKHKSYNWVAAVTSQAIWTPTSNHRFVITDIILSVEESCRVTLFDNANIADNHIIYGVFSDTGGLVSNFSKDVYSAAFNNVLRITTDGGKGAIVIFGFESVWTPPA